MTSGELFALPFGKRKVHVRVPAKNLLAYASLEDVAGVPDPVRAIEDALDSPIGSASLHSKVKPGDKVAIAIDDFTRPTPSKLILESLLPRLHEAGVAVSDIDILVATGMHRPLTDAEIVDLVGQSIFENYRVSNHQPYSDTENQFIGATKSGNNVSINRTFLAADVRILTGYIRPHVVFGFSGGRKSVVPGLADVETVKFNHRREWVVHHPNCDNLILEDNPAHLDATDIARRVGIDFIVNAVLNRKKEVVKIVAGDLEQAWLAGVEVVRKMVVFEVPEPADIVISTPGGFPDDIDMYQTLGSIIVSRKRPVFKKGATFIFAAECKNGVGNEKMLATFKTASTPGELARRIRAGEPVINGHVSYAFSHFISHHDLTVLGHTGFVTDEDLKAMYIQPAPDLQVALDSALAAIGPNAKVLIVPNAKTTVPVSAF